MSTFRMDGQEIPYISYDDQKQKAVSKINETPQSKKYHNKSSIDWNYEYKKERSRKLHLVHTAKNVSLTMLKDDSTKWFVMIVSSLLMGYAASLIDLSSLWLNDFKTGYCSKFFYLSKANCCTDVGDGEVCPNWKEWNTSLRIEESVGSFAIRYFIYIITGLILAMATTFLTSFAPMSRNSGISEIKAILSGYILDDFLTMKTLLVKSIGLVLIVSSGIWVGKEGPLVHVSCCILSLVIKTVPHLNKNEALKRELLSAAAATGITASFNAPIGGVLFTLEQVSSFFDADKMMWNSFVCSTVAVTVLQFMKPFQHGSQVLFKVDFNEVNWFNFEIIPFMMLGALGGVYGLAFNKLNLFFAQKRENFWLKYPRFKYLEIFALSLITSLINFPLILTRLPLNLYITKLFKDCSAETSNSSLDFLCKDYSKTVPSFQLNVIIVLYLISLQGFLLSAYSYGTFIPAGILMPSLAMGATVGRIFGILIEYIQLSHPHWEIFINCSTQTCISPGSYAVVGAASFLTGVTKMTVTVVVIVFELTGAISYVLPIMISVLVSKFVNDGLMNENFYELWNRVLRISSFNSKESIIPIIPTSKIMLQKADIICLYNDEMNLVDLRNIIQTFRYNGFPLLKSRRDPTVLGYVTYDELAAELSRLESLGIDSSSKFMFVDESGSDSNNLNDTSSIPGESGELSGIDGNRTTNRIKSRIIIELQYIKIRPTTLLPTLIQLFKKFSLNHGIITESNILVGLVTKKQLTIMANSDFEPYKTNPQSIFSRYRPEISTRNIAGSESVGLTEEFELYELNNNNSSGELIN